jgi:uncharacterized protein
MVYNVNPTLDEIDGDPSYASLRDVAEPIDIVDVFRRSENLRAGCWLKRLGRCDDRLGAVGVEDDAARRQGFAAGLNVAMNLCAHRARTLIRTSIQGIKQMSSEQ